MPRKYELTPHLSRDIGHDLIEGTYRGQAHIAGTDPKGRTCRQCIYWGLADGQKVLPPGHNPKGDINQGRCNTLTGRKSNALFPHFAKACRLIEQRREEIPAKIEPRPKPEKADG